MLTMLEEYDFYRCAQWMFHLLSDLIREITIDCEIDFFKLSSYGDEKISSGQATLLKDLDFQVSGRDIIVVEDIVDTGLSIAFIKKIIEKENPKSIKLFHCYEKRIPKLDFRSIISDLKSAGFVIGYGLDYAQKVRNLKSIYRLALQGTSKPE